jgi:phosphate transport system permease protein
MKSEIKNLNKRNRSEKRFQTMGKASILLALIFLAALFFSIFSKGTTAFFKTKIALEINLEKYQNLNEVDHRQIIKEALIDRFKIDSKSVSEKNSLYQIISKISSLELKKYLRKNPEILGKKEVIWFSASSKIDMFYKKNNESLLNEKQLIWAKKLQQNQELKISINFDFFRYADSREPEIAGVGAGIIGSILVMVIFLLLAFPIAVMCAFYLEEFAPKNKITDIIEVSINNLAAIPSIIYGLLGLTLYLQIINLPRSSSLVGGLTLFMLVLPVIIIAARNTIRSIPNSIRDGAAALGASKMQIAMHHLLPLSMPGIMTGTILAISRALGETAPLLMVGMVAFIADIPSGFLDPTTVLPVQIYLWSDSPEFGFAEKTSAAIIILLGFLIFLNLIAVFLRKKFERNW